MGGGKRNRNKLRWWWSNLFIIIFFPFFKLATTTSSRPKGIDKNKKIRITVCFPFFCQGSSGTPNLFFPWGLKSFLRWSKPLSGLWHAHCVNNNNNNKKKQRNMWAWGEKHVCNKQSSKVRFCFVVNICSSSGPREGEGGEAKVTGWHHISQSWRVSCQKSDLARSHCFPRWLCVRRPEDKRSAPATKSVVVMQKCKPNYQFETFIKRKADLVPGLSVKGKRVGGTLVVTEPDIGLMQIARLVLLNVINVWYWVFSEQNASEYTQMKRLRVRKTIQDLENLPLSLSARGSLTLMAMIFQSVSPSSISAMRPKYLTWIISPLLATASPISHTSTGSPSPLRRQKWD